MTWVLTITWSIKFFIHTKEWDFLINLKWLWVKIWSLAVVSCYLHEGTTHSAFLPLEVLNSKMPSLQYLTVEIIQKQVLQRQHCDFSLQDPQSPKTKPWPCAAAPPFSIWLNQRSKTMGRLRTKSDYEDLRNARILENQVLYLFLSVLIFFFDNECVYIHWQWTGNRLAWRHWDCKKQSPNSDQLLRLQNLRRPTLENTRKKTTRSRLCAAPIVWSRHLPPPTSRPSKFHGAGLNA